MGRTAKPGAAGPDGSSKSFEPGAAHARTGVRGWLLVLCLMMTVVGPAISVWIVDSEFDALAVQFVTSRGAQWAMILTIALTTCSILFGIYAGLRLWAIKPQAVRVGKAALSFGLVVDVCTTTISTILVEASPADAELIYRVLLNVAPGLVFFTVCLAYLNKSRRVEATYGSDC